MRLRRYPPFTAFPVALWIASFAFDLASFRLGHAFVLGAFANASLACVVALFALMTGWHGWNRVPSAHPVRRIGVAHAVTTLSAFAFFCVALWLRAKAIDAAHTPTSVLVITGVGLVLLAGADVLSRMLAEVAISPARLALILSRPEKPTTH